MANIVPFSFPVELLSGTHNFASGGNTFRISLYTSLAAYSTSSTAYDTTGEVSTGGGSQYSAQDLATNAVSNVSNIATVDFTTNPNWGSPTPATFSALGAAIYNTSASNKLIVVLDFGATFSCSNGTFTVTFPDPTSGSPSGADALISITS
tara:strand:+ start:53 stop:505 length:453 start_codon:yes stop_codon:yes gene_type:complete